MTDEELRDELVTLLVAGHETTATALSWALYWIHRLPEVKEKLLAELATLEYPLKPSGVCFAVPRRGNRPFALPQCGLLRGAAHLPSRVSGATEDHTSSGEDWRL
jgi:cytochrome P450